MVSAKAWRDAGRQAARSSYAIDGIKQAMATAASGKRDGKLLLLPNG